jgi:F0F1-type ATP synthase assembly protein I
MRVPEEDRWKAGAYYTLPFGFAAAVGIFVFLGWRVDLWLDASPIFTIVGAFVGLAAGLFYLVRHALEMQGGGRGKEKDNDGSSEPSA